MAATSSPERILIVRPSALGDVCRTVPVLASLRRAFPSARIDWLVRDTFAPAIASHPALDETIEFPRARFARWWRKPSVAREALGWLRGLRRRRYDLVIDFQGLGRSGFFTRATGAKRRVGFRDARELAWLGYNVRHERASAAHTVDEMLSLVTAEGIETIRDLALTVPAEERGWWEDERRRLDLAGASYAVLAPTARWATKRWPIDLWRELAGPLLEQDLDRLVVIGAPGEDDQVQGIEPSDPEVAGRLVHLVGRTTVAQTMAVIAESSLVIANDSAPLHMAVGLNRPCVALFGPTAPDRVGPYGRPEAVVRSPRAEEAGQVNYRSARLGDSLMRDITVEIVLERAAAVRALEGAGRRGDAHARTRAGAPGGSGA